MDLPAPWAAEPIATPKPLHDPDATSIRLLSKVTSKFTPATWAPSKDARLTGTCRPVSPGAPELLPTERLAVGAKA